RTETRSRLPQPDHRRALLACGLLFGLSMGLYAFALRNDFVNYDDPDYVTGNPSVLAGLSWRSAAWAFRTVHSANCHPLTWLPHRVDVQLFGPHAAGHHLSSALLHAANVLLLFLLLYRGSGRLARAFAVAALFAVHPLNVQSVAWIAQRKTLLCASFVLLTL